MDGLGDRIRRRRRVQGMTQIDLARAAGVNQGYLSEIERNRRRPGRAALAALAAALDVPEAVLIGAGADHDAPQPLETRDLPLYGSIPAGPPSASQEQQELFPVLRHLWAPDRYCLRLEYDSMEPTLKPGDIILVHYRPEVNPLHVQGRICACLVDDEPTLKRISVERHDGAEVVILRGDNPDRPPMLIGADRSLNIQGVAICLVSRLL